MDTGLITTVKILMLAGMLVGLLGSVVPVFPGLTVIWALVVIYVLVFDLSTAGMWLFVITSVLAIIGWLSDNVLMGGKARYSGASWRSIALAMVAGFVGSLVLTPLGGIPAALLVLFLSEYSIHGDRDEALEITKSMAIGCGWAVAIRMAIGFVIIVLWAVWAF